MALSTVYSQINQGESTLENAVNVSEGEAPSSSSNNFSFLPQIYIEIETFK